MLRNACRSEYRGCGVLTLVRGLGLVVLLTLLAQLPQVSLAQAATISCPAFGSHAGGSNRVLRANFDSNSGALSCAYESVTSDVPHVDPVTYMSANAIGVILAANDTNSLSWAGPTMGNDTLGLHLAFRAVGANAATAPTAYACSGTYNNLSLTGNGTLWLGLADGQVCTLSATAPSSGSGADTIVSAIVSRSGGIYSVSQVSIDYTAGQPPLTSTLQVSSIFASVGTPVTSTPVVGAGGVTPYAFAVAPALPAGLTLNASTGVVTGSPTVVSASTSYTLTVTDSTPTTPQTSSRSFSIEVSKGAQAAVHATASPGSISFGGATLLATTGGSGTGAVSYVVTAGGSFCSLSGNTVTGIGVGTCTITATKAGDSNYISAADTVDIAITKASQTISFTDPANVAAFVDNSTVSLSATGGASGNPVTFASNSTGVCTVSGSTATLIAAGTCTITASQATSTNYLAAADVQQSFTIGQGTQSISFTDPADRPSFVSGATVSLVATGGASGNSVTFASTTTGICTVSGAQATVVAAGTCSITASQSGNSNYLAAADVVQSFQIGQASQTISFTDPADIAQFSTGASVALVATGGDSGNAISYTSNSASVCTVSGSTASVLGAGTCSITASQAGDSNYLAATNVTQTFSIGQGSQTISFTDPSDIPGFVPNQTVTLSATGGASGNAVTFSSTTSGVCTVSGTTATIVAAGTCSITATQAGNSNYLAANPVVQSFLIDSAVQVITFADIANVAAYSPVASVSLVATGGASGNPVTFASTTSAICTVSGNNAIVQAAGTCSITASQAGNSSYFPAASVSKSFAIGKAPQAISFADPVDISSFVANDTVNLQATGGASTSPVVFSSTSPTVCTVTGNLATILTAGTCAITATQAGDANYTAASAVSQAFGIGKLSQTISFAAPADVPEFEPNDTVDLFATGGASGNAIVFSTSTTAVCGVSGQTATILAAGTCTVLAQQVGNVNYYAATDVSRSFNIGRGTQLITFAPLSDMTFSPGREVALSATSSIGAPVVFASTTPDICSIVSGKAVLLDVGSCEIEASHAGNSNYIPVTVARSFMSLAEPAITLAVSANPSSIRTVGEIVTFTYAVSNGGNVPLTGIAISDNRVTEIICATTTIAPAASTSCTGRLASTDADVVAKVISTAATVSGVYDGQTVTSSSANASVGVDVQAVAAQTQTSINAFGQRQANLVTVAGPIISRSHARLRGSSHGSYATGLRATSQAAAAAGRSSAFSPVDGLETSSLPINASGSGTEHAGRLSFSMSLNEMLAIAEAQAMGLDPSNPNLPLAGRDNRFDIWMRGEAGYVRTKAAGGGRDKSQSYVLSTGADLVVNSSLLVGVSAETDWLAVDPASGYGSMSGQGWMAGPYISARLSDNLFFDASASWGRARNKIDPLGAYEDSYRVKRAMATASLTGEWNIGNLIFSPTAGVLWYRERQKGYVDSLGSEIEANQNVLGRANFGPKISYRAEFEDGSSISPYVGIEGIWDFETESSGQSLRAQIEAGTSYRTASGMTLSASGTYEGIGDDKVEAYRGMLQLLVPIQ